MAESVKSRKSRESMLIYGGAAVGVLAAGYIFKDQLIQLIFPTPPAQLSLSVQPSEVQEGSGVHVIASGNYTVNGQPSAGSIYMRVRHPNGTTYDNFPTRTGPSFTESIPTSGKPVGEYVVEVSDNPSFI